MKISSLLKAIGVCTLIANSSLTFAAENNTSNHKILIAYFSFPLPEEVDSTTSASRLEVNGQTFGSVEYVADIIAKNTGGDLFKIETVQQYPIDEYDHLTDFAHEEQENDARPTLKNTIANFDEYDTVFVGYPIWWYQMPMALYTFFDNYDFSGKTIIPFSTHGGSRWSGTTREIERLEPNAKFLDGYSIYRSMTPYDPEDIAEWLKDINIVK